MSTIPTNILTQYLQALKCETIYPPQGSIRIAYLPDNYNITWKTIQLTSLARRYRNGKLFAAMDNLCF